MIVHMMLSAGAVAAIVVSQIRAPTSVIKCRELEVGVHKPLNAHLCLALTAMVNCCNGHSTFLQFCEELHVISQRTSWMLDN